MDKVEGLVVTSNDDRIHVGIVGQSVRQGTTLKKLLENSGYTVEQINDFYAVPKEPTMSYAIADVGTMHDLRNVLDVIPDPVRPLPCPIPPKCRKGGRRHGA